MCLIAFSYRNHPRYDLVFAANRDEIYRRPTREAGFWDREPQLLAGKDLKAGGTWLGMTRQGKLAALTNFRDMSNFEKKPTSRGHLVLNYLAEHEGDTADYLRGIDREADRYNGFNLIAGSVCRLMYYSNRQQVLHTLPPGLYGLSNHLLDTPWPKVEKAKKRLSDLLEEDRPDPEEIFRLLQDTEEASPERLPDTGLSPEREKAVSPVFIRSEDYGTRSSTVIMVDKEGEVRFEERRYRAGETEVTGRNRYEFTLEG